jgi:anti-sigma B factor antagonist
MNTPSARLMVLTGEKFACIRIIGRANFRSSVGFRDLVNELRQRSFEFFVLELSECLLMDSTFLGTLAGLGLKMNPRQDPESSPVELLNPSDRIIELLESLGVLHLFRVAYGAAVPQDAQLRQHSAPNPNREEATRACLEAHRTLMQLSPENASRFKDLTQFLEDDLKKIRA